MEIRRVLRGVLLGCLVAVIVLMILCLLNRRSVFSGNRVKNPDCYTMEFTKMNQSDSHSFSLKEGDSISVDYEIDKGHVDLRVGESGEDALFIGNNIGEGHFTLPIPKDGNYTVEVKANHAAGEIFIYTKTE